MDLNLGPHSSLDQPSSVREPEDENFLQLWDPEGGTFPTSSKTLLNPTLPNDFLAFMTAQYLAWDPSLAHEALVLMASSHSLLQVIHLDNILHMGWTSCPIPLPTPKTLASLFLHMGFVKLEALPIDNPLISSLRQDFEETKGIRNAKSDVKLDALKPEMDFNNKLSLLFKQVNTVLLKRLPHKNEEYGHLLEFLACLALDNTVRHAFDAQLKLTDCLDTCLSMVPEHQEKEIALSISHLARRGKAATKYLAKLLFIGPKPYLFRKSVFFILLQQLLGAPEPVYLKPVKLQHVADLISSRPLSSTDIVDHLLEVIKCLSQLDSYWDVDSKERLYKSLGPLFRCSEIKDRQDMQLLKLLLGPLPTTKKVSFSKK